MIPLALYGLDNPKIPMLLVDFRDSDNPKKREMSGRVFAGRHAQYSIAFEIRQSSFFPRSHSFRFCHRPGAVIDINQPSRLRTYSQLKLLLALTNSLEPELRDEVNGRLEKLALNPFENDLDAEANVAREQYAALVTYAGKPDGLAVRLERDRRAELVSLEHGPTAQLAFRLANVFSFGKYVHREQLTSDMPARLDIARRLDYHTKFLQQVSRSNFEIDVACDIEEVKRSLRFVADHGDEAGVKAVAAAAGIFTRAKDEETRRACLESLSRINKPKARSELLRISQNKELDQTWRDIAESYLRQANQREQPIAASAVGSPLRVGQP